MRKLSAIKRDLRTRYSNIASARRFPPGKDRDTVIAWLEREAQMVQVELDMRYMLRN